MSRAFQWGGLQGFQFKILYNNERWGTETVKTQHTLHCVNFLQIMQKLLFNPVTHCPLVWLQSFYTKEQNICQVQD